MIQTIHNFVRIIQELRPSSSLPCPFQPVGLTVVVRSSSDGALAAGRWLLAVFMLHRCTDVRYGSTAALQSVQSPSRPLFWCCTLILLVKSNIERISILNVLYLCSYFHSPTLHPFSLFHHLSPCTWCCCCCLLCRKRWWSRCVVTLAHTS